MEQSWRLQRPVESQEVETVCDGVAVRVPMPAVLPVMKEVVDDMLLVPDSLSLSMMRELFYEEGVLAEGAGAIALAAASMMQDELQGHCVGIIMCGSNLSRDQIQQYILEEPT